MPPIAGPRHTGNQRRKDLPSASDLHPNSWPKKKRRRRRAGGYLVINPVFAVLAFLLSSGSSALAFHHPVFGPLKRQKPAGFVITSSRSSRQGEITSASLSAPIPAPEQQEQEEEGHDDGEEGGSVASLGLWEIFRELDRREVIYNVLQPRAELTRLLLQARRKRPSSGGRLSTSIPTGMYNDQGEEEDATMMPQQEIKEREKTRDMHVPASAPAVPLPPAAVSKTDASIPPPSAQAATTAAGGTPLSRSPVFASIADALAWAGKLSEEEIRVELDFLNVSLEEGTKTMTHSQLARRLARAVMDSSSSSAAATAADGGIPLRETEMEAVKRQQLSHQVPKSKARQQRMMRQLQREEGLDAYREPGRYQSKYGGEERLLDVDHAREELKALRDRALDVFEGRNGKRSMPAGASGRGRGKNGGGGERGMAAAVSSLLASDDASGRFRSRGGDLALRAFEKATRVADRAINWVTEAKSMARGAMIAATTTDDDTDPRAAGGAGGSDDINTMKKLQLQEKSQALLGPRGRRWSKFGGVMARAGMESAWQVVMASASWAGGGLLPGKYVLLGAGAFSLLLRSGFGTYMATLLVVRTCSSTLRNIIEDEDKGSVDEF